MGIYKCAITRKPCPRSFDTWADGNEYPENCPIGRYMNSDIRYNPGENERGTIIRMDSTCRYFGLKRYSWLRQHEFIKPDPLAQYDFITEGE